MPFATSSLLESELLLRGVLFEFELERRSNCATRSSKLLLVLFDDASMVEFPRGRRKNAFGPDASPAVDESFRVGSKEFG